MSAKFFTVTVLPDAVVSTLFDPSKFIIPETGKADPVSASICVTSLPACPES